MAVIMMMKWDGVSLEQYESVRSLVDWDHNVPPGGVLHLCTHDGGALRVVDVWETPESFQSFVETRLMPGVAQTGITSEPQVEVYPAHNVFHPYLVAKQ